MPLGYCCQPISDCWALLCALAYLHRWWFMPDGSMPAELWTPLRRLNNFDHLRGCPSSVGNRGPWSKPRIAKLDNSSATGHNSLQVLPMKGLITRRVWLVLDPFRVNWTTEVSYLLFREMSMGIMGQLRWKELTEGVFISPNCKKAKKPRQQVAQSIVLSCLNGSWFSVRSSMTLTP